MLSALLEDQPGKDLVRGQVGTVVETLAPGVFEVEFSDNDGRTYASVTLKASQLYFCTTSWFTQLEF